MKNIFSGIDGNLKKRTLSAVVLGAVALGLTIKGGILFLLFIGVLFAAMGYEWRGLCREGKLDAKWFFVGLFYFNIACLSFFYLRMIPTNGLDIIIWLLSVVWATDIGAYFVGKKIGKTPLAPQISPNKTREGALGGLVTALVVGFIVSQVLGATSFAGAIFLSIVLSIAAQIGDLFESWVKRKVGVKDSGNLIPGHGGILDRVDSVLLASIAAVFLY